VFNRRIAVAHQIRLAPSVIRLREAVSDGLIGDVLQVRAWGKQDDRAGGEDMIVLGSHLFDLMRFFAGNALYCSARVMANGRDITRADARTVTEQIGPVAGDAIEAQFAFEDGVQGSFVSRKSLRESVGHWGLELVGSKGSARILTEIYASIYLQRPAAWNPEGRAASWTRWAGDPGVDLAPEARGSEAGNRRVADDWLMAIRDNREPVCSGRAAMKSLELIMAVYHAALEGKRVTLPLAARDHPLG
jgi:predicted dehydrogenase